MTRTRGVPVVRTVATRPALSLVCAWLVIAVACGQIQAKQKSSAAAEATSSAAPVQIQRIQLIAGSTGWALTSDHLDFSQNGGESWTDITPPGVAASSIGDVYFLNSQEGWLETPVGETSASDLSIYHTVDSGKTWTSSLLTSGKTSSASASIDFTDSDNGWVVLKAQGNTATDEGQLFHTTDGGSAWQEESIPLGDPVRFSSSSVGFVAGGPVGNMFYRTVDAGRTWNRVSVSAPASYEANYSDYELPNLFSDSNGVLPVTFEASGNTNESAIGFYSTRDAGASWTLLVTIPSPTSANALIATSVIDSNTWLAADPAGKRIFIVHADGTYESEAPAGLPDVNGHPKVSKGGQLKVSTPRTS